MEIRRTRSRARCSICRRTGNPGRLVEHSDRSRVARDTRLLICLVYSNACNRPICQHCYSPGLTSAAVTACFVADDPSWISASTLPARFPGRRRHHIHSETQSKATGCSVNRTCLTHSMRVSRQRILFAPSLMIVAESRKGAPLSGRARSDIT